MKRTLPVFLALLAMAAPAARAQSDMIIKQRAKDLRDANNAQQGVPPPAAPGAPQPPPPTLSPAEQEAKRNLDKFEADLNTFKPGVEVSADQKQTLQTDLFALAHGSVKPSTNSLSKLADDLCAALSADNTAIHQSSQLARAVNVIVNSSMGSKAQAQPFIQIAQTALKSSGVPDNAALGVCDDLTAILSEVQKKTPKLYQ